ncbi:MAG: hypothetical protein MUP70_00420, partial [Candidatus Aminicenantes bacterium]|nr:hypothetical protein [Candidatus Aminicenantes bacterium]
PGRPGINAVSWDLRFPLTENELSVFKKKLQVVCRKLEGLVKDDTERKDVERILERVGTESSERGLGRLHRELIQNFAAYSQGRDLFGSALEPITAEAGIYKITLSVDGKVLTGQLTIRNDPLLED